MPIIDTTDRQTVPEACLGPLQDLGGNLEIAVIASALSVMVPIAAVIELLERWRRR